jgi:hypothetical protein
MEEHQEMGDTSQSNGTSIRIPINSLWLDRPRDFVGDAWQLTKDAVGCITLLFEPIMDRTSLVDLSIGLLILEHIGSRLQPFEVQSLNDKMTAQQPLQHVADMGERHDALWTSDIFGSPAIAIFGTLALLFSCLANSSYDSRLLAPVWLRMVMPHQSSAVLLYVLLILFCLESVILLSIILLAFHALTFPQYIEEDLAILFIMTGVWICSLFGSTLMRHFLYYSMGD